MEQSRRDRKKVTVMIPIYNGEKYIEETVRSVLAQTYSNLEILCVIDGTADRSAAIVQQLGDPRITVLEKENRGACYRRNEAIQIAEGSYLWFLDQDDLLQPECIEAAVQELEKSGSAAVAVNGHLIDGKGSVIRRLYRVNKPELTLASLAKGNRLFTTSQVLIDRETMKRLGGFHQQAGIADDWDLWIRLLKSGEKMSFVDRYLMCYRQHDSNHSRNVEKMMQSEKHVLEHSLHQVGKPDTNKSYSYMRYSERAADWKALSNAVRLNKTLIVNPRLYWVALKIAASRRSAGKNGGVAG